VTFGINGAELIILVLLAVLILGPEKLPEYTRKLTEWIRTLRRMAEGAKSQFKEETGTDFDEIDWKKYDPRQYDPRRIIKDALAEPVDGSAPSSGSEGANGRSGASRELTGGNADSTAGPAEGEWRSDLHAVRAQRDELREDLKDMDPRALFFGKSSSRSGSAQAAGAVAAGAAAGATLGAGRVAADEAPADGDGTVLDETGVDETGLDETGVERAGADGRPVDEGAADGAAWSAPFDSDAT
jgi:sec-independent protein translocase protein TatB